MSVHSEITAPPPLLPPAATRSNIILSHFLLSRLTKASKEIRKEDTSASTLISTDGANLFLATMTNHQTDRQTPTIKTTNEEGIPNLSKIE